MAGCHYCAASGLLLLLCPCLLCSSCRDYHVRSYTHIVPQWFLEIPHTYCRWWGRRALLQALSFALTHTPLGPFVRRHRTRNDMHQVGELASQTGALPLNYPLDHVSWQSMSGMMSSVKLRVPHSRVCTHVQ